MVKKMKLPFLFMKPTETTTLTPSWPWPTCGNPKTLSFRAPGENHVVFKTTLSTPPLDSSSSSEEGEEDSTSIEKVVIRGLRSERLFFEPAGDTCSSSILDLQPQEVEEGGGVVVKNDAVDDDDDDGELIGRFKESVVMAVVDSTDPFVDFRRSMQEMVESRHQGRILMNHKDHWEFLEELLTIYLRVNGKTNHGYIVGAFVDLLVHLALSSSSSSPPPSSSDDDDQYCYCSSSSSYSCSTTTNSFTSPLSFSSCSTFSTTTSTPCTSLSILEVDDDDDDDDDDGIQKSMDDDHRDNISSSDT